MVSLMFMVGMWMPVSRSHLWTGIVSYPSGFIIYQFVKLGWNDQNNERRCPFWEWKKFLLGSAFADFFASGEILGDFWPLLARSFVVPFEKILHSRLFRFGLDLFLVVCIQIWFIYLIYQLESTYKRILVKIIFVIESFLFVAPSLFCGDVKLANLWRQPVVRLGRWN